MNPDFTFRSVNPQFCKLLGVTPADLIGERYQDITPPKLRRLEETNCRLLMDGSIGFYLLPKTFLFPYGHRVEVMLLVTRVPVDAGAFQFFVCRVMLDEKAASRSRPKSAPAKSPRFSQKWIGSAVEFALNYGKTLFIVGTVLAGAAVYVINLLSDMASR